MSLRIPDSIPADRLPDLLRYWYCGNRARRHLSTRRFETVTALLGAARTGRALDVGCGWGYNLHLLHHAGFDAVGIDIVPDDFLAARHVAAENGYPVDLVCADVSALPFPESIFIAVTSIETFEHIYDADRPLAARQIARACAPGGLLALSTPNYRSLVERGKRFIVKVPALKRLFPSMCYPVGAVDRHEYHPYRYHRPLPAEELRRLLDGAGFDVIEMRTILFVWKNVPDILFPLCRILESALERIPGIRRLASTLIVLARRR
jgi:2-polyprenyl-3-methyl-5-hydroxy-6-metoxy-1,4-benzoquinol methylase